MHKNRTKYNRVNMFYIPATVFIFGGLWCSSDANFRGLTPTPYPNPTPVPPKAMDPLPVNARRGVVPKAPTPYPMETQTASGIATPTANIVTTPPYECKDILSNSMCNYYSVGCKAQGAQLKWAIAYCPSYCGLCKAAVQCGDRADCRYYDTIARCQSTSWTYDNCALTCGYCRMNTICHDRADNCQHLPSEVCSGTFLAWATSNCAKTCGLCHNTTPNTGSPAVPTAPVTPPTAAVTPTPASDHLIG